MSKDPDNQEDEFSLDDYDDTEDEGLDLPDIEDELGSFDEDEDKDEDEDEDEDKDEDEDEDKDEDEDEEKDEDEDEDKVEEKAEKKEKLKEEDDDKKGEEKEAEVATAPSPEEISRDEITLPLTVEIGRINLSLEKLLQLKEGNVLDLSIQPESGVDIVINGQCIGKGELLKAGNSIAVRILDLA